MDFYQSEDTDGVRLSWNVLPLNRNWAEKIVLPVGVHYTPLKNIPDLEFLGDAPVACAGCQSVLNPYCAVDLNTKSYQCAICGARSGLPQSKVKYLTENKTLPEIQGNCTTIEYLLDEKIRERGYIFLVDKCIPADEIQEIKTAIMSAVQNLSDDNYVALITFDRNIFVQDLEETEFLSEYSMNGSKEYDYQRIAKLLQFQLPAEKAVNHTPGERLNAIFRPLEKCRAVFERAVDKIKADRWPVPQNERPSRAFGAALKVALTMTSGWFQHVEIC
jgi:protein transport protein SEC23